MELMFRALAPRQSEWRRANPRNVNFAISSRWKFDPWQLVWYQILVFQFPTDAASQFLSKLSFHCCCFFLIGFIEFILLSLIWTPMYNRELRQARRRWRQERLRAVVSHTLNLLHEHFPFWGSFCSHSCLIPDVKWPVLRLCSQSEHLTTLFWIFSTNFQTAQTNLIPG